MPYPSLFHRALYIVYLCTRFYFHSYRLGPEESTLVRVTTGPPYCSHSSTPSKFLILVTLQVHEHSDNAWGQELRLGHGVIPKRPDKDGKAMPTHTTVHLVRKCLIASGRVFFRKRHYSPIKISPDTRNFPIARFLFVWRGVCVVFMGFGASWYYAKRSLLLITDFQLFWHSKDS